MNGPRRRPSVALARADTSNGGPSPYGFGWDLPLGKITRRRKDGAPCGDPGEYVVVLPNATIECRLQGSTRCRPRREESFLDIRRADASSPWEVRDKSGTRFVFGGPAATMPSELPPGPCGATSTWALTSIVDTNGNAIQISYEAYENVSYPVSIRYGGRLEGGNPTPVFAHPFEVTFTWQGRPAGDLVQSGGAGYQKILTRRLERIDVRHGSQVVRSYAFAYRDSGRGRRSMLAAVTLHGRDGQPLRRSDGNPASTVFLYQDTVTPADVVQAGQPARNGFDAPQYPRGHYPAASMALPLRKTESESGARVTTIDMFDIDGDGFVDHVFTNLDNIGSNSNSCVYFPGSPTGPLPTPRLWSLGAPADMAAIRRVGNKPDHSACGWTGPVSYTELDTVDVDGDGIVDFVDARQSLWKVYRGYRDQQGGGFYADAKIWNAGQPWTSMSRHMGGGMTEESAALLDWNGDGRPDLVEAWPAYCPQLPSQPDWLWKVRLNTGSETVDAGFRQAYPVTDNPKHFLGRTTSSGDMNAGSFDINGDGLTDFVLSPDCIASAAAGYWKVWLNDGRFGFRYEEWPLPAMGGGHTPSCAGGAPLNGSMLIRRRIDGTNSKTPRDFLDINGDGLPDVVDEGTVRLNRGSGFAESTIDWSNLGEAVRREVSGPSSEDLLIESLIDIDGDGMVDRVRWYSLVLDGSGNPPPGYPFGLYAYEIRRNLGGGWKAAAGAWPEQVVANPHGLRPDLLRAMENGIGGRTRLEYRPSSQWDNTGGDGIADLPFNLWTLTRIERRDGMCAFLGCVNAGSAHTLVTNIRYQGGLYDAATRELRGFRLVTTEDAEPADPEHRFTATYFHQGEAFAGKVMQRAVYRHPGGGGNPWNHPISLEANTWECAHPVTGEVLSPCPEPLAEETWVRLGRTDTIDYALDNVAIFRTAYVANRAWAPPCKGRMTGNVAEVERGGTSTDVVRTFTEYACNEGVTAPYVLDKPKRVRVEGPGATEPLEEKWFVYDGLGHGSVSKGNVSRVESWLSASALASSPSCTGPGGGGRSCVASSQTYDAFGNILTVTDAAGNVTQTTYDATNIHAREVRNAAGHIVGTIHDPACGKLVSQTIAYAPGTGPPEAHPRTHLDLDSFCRPWRAYGVYDPPDLPAPLDGRPEQEMFYDLGGLGTPSVIRTIRRTGDASFLESATLLDALGRPIQVKEEKVVAGQEGVYSSTTEYDDRGNVVRRYLPATDTLGWFMYRPPAAQASRMGFNYDAIGRPVRAINPDGTFRDTDHRRPWKTVARDECASGGTCDGTATAEHRDAFGRVVRTETFQVSAGVETLYSATRADYDGLGRLLATEQAEGAVWKPATRILHTYDSLGRRLETLDPDSGDQGVPGRWRTGYDLVGNPIFSDDARGGQHIQYCYDSIGRVTRKFVLDTSDWTGPASRVSCQAAATVTYHYDDPDVEYGLGRLHLVEDPTGWTAHTAFDARGRVQQTRKQVGGVTAMVRYQYDSADKVKSIVYPDAEEVVYSYDREGRVIGLENTEPPNSQIGKAVYLAGATFDVFGRLLTQTRGNDAVDEREYWDASKSHRLKSIRTRKGSTNHLRYQYPDYRPTGQLLQIDDLKHNLNNTLSNSAKFDYDAFGRLTRVHESRVDGDYAYDALGNLTLKDGTSLVPRTDKPHVLWKVGATTVVHNANGSRVSSVGRTYHWNAEGRLFQIQTSGGVAATFYYDHAGDLAVRLDSAFQTTRYFFGLAELRGGALVKHYMAGGQLLATRSGPAPVSLDFASAEQPWIRLARSAPGRGLVVLLRPDAAAWSALALTLLFSALLLRPGSPARRAAGLALRRGHVLLVLLTFTAATFPLPIALLPFSPADAWGGGVPPGTPPPPGPTPTPTPVPPKVLEHYHHDHLGSTHLVTTDTGACKQYLRYRAYGQVRLRGPCTGTTNPETINRFEFTGYESESATGLQYAGARHFDPATGMFLSHDPAGQFTSPYAYGPWDPINGTDPGGRWWFVVAAIQAIKAFAVAHPIATAAIVGAAVSSIQAAANGASLGQVAKAGVIGAAVSGASVVGLGIVGAAVGATGSKVAVYAFQLALVGSSGYGLAQSVRSGQALTGVVSAIGLAFGVAGLMEGGGGGSVAQGGNGLSTGDQLNFARQEFGLRFGGTFDAYEVSILPGFGDQDAAAAAALRKANPPSISENLEYGGYVYDQGGAYDYTLPQRGTPTGFQPSSARHLVPGGASIVGDYHTHGDYSQVIGGKVVRTTPALDAFNSNHFSSQDLIGIRADAIGIPSYRGYLGTPSGMFRAYDPAFGRVYTIR